MSSRWQRLEVFNLSSRKQDTQNLQVAKFVYVPTSDAKERLYRAIAILLKTGMKKKKNERR
jgi:hypothetical protein